MRNIWALRLTTFTLWLLAAASLTYWLLQTTARAQPAPALASAQVAGVSNARLSPDPAAVAQGLGAVGSAPDRNASGANANAAGSWNSGRFKLSGILAQGSVQDGLIMLSVDGKPVQILRLGSTVEPGVVVQSLTRQSVTLANTKNASAGQTFTLTLGEINGSIGNTAGKNPPPPLIAGDNNTTAPLEPFSAPISAPTAGDSPFPVPAPASRTVSSPFPVPQRNTPKAALMAPSIAADTDAKSSTAQSAAAALIQQASPPTTAAPSAISATGSNKGAGAAATATPSTPNKKGWSDDDSSLYFGH